MFKRPVVFSSLLLILILLISCLPKARTDVRPSFQFSGDEERPLPVDQSKLAWVDRHGRIRTYEQTQKALLGIMDKGGASGLSIVLKQGRDYSNNPSVYTFYLGVEDPENRKPIEALTVFRADRLGQPVIAYIVMMLATYEYLDLDRPLYKYLPKSAIANSPYQDILSDPRFKRLTARRILSHQSGLVNSRLARPEKKLAFTSSPGTGFQYSDEGYGFLRFVLEKRFDTSLNELARSCVFEPFGMKRTSFVREPRFEGHIATAAGGDSIMESPASTVLSTFFTNASDYARFLWSIRLENPYLSREAYMSFIISPAISIRSPSILEPARCQDNQVLPPKLSWCLGWGTYHIPRVELGFCSFIGQRDHGMESYATTFGAQNSTAITIFVVSKSHDSCTPMILRELLGEMETPLLWLGF